MQRLKQIRPPFTIQQWERTIEPFTGNGTNLLVRSLSGKEPQSRTRLSKVTIGDDDLEMAKEALKMFDVVLMLNYDNNVKDWIFNYMLGMKDEKQIFENVKTDNDYSTYSRTTQPATISPEVRWVMTESEELEKYKAGWLSRNSYDMRLFEWANQTFRTTPLYNAAMQALCGIDNCRVSHP